MLLCASTWLTVSGVLLQRTRWHCFAPRQVLFRPVSFQVLIDWSIPTVKLLLVAPEQGRSEGDKRAQLPRHGITAGVPKSHNNVTSTSFNTRFFKANVKYLGMDL